MVSQFKTSKHLMRIVAVCISLLLIAIPLTAQETNPQPNLRIRTADTFRFEVSEATTEYIVAQDMTFNSTIEMYVTRINGMPFAGALHIGDMIIIDPDGRREYALVTGLNAGLGNTRCPVNGMVASGKTAAIELYGEYKVSAGDVIVRLDEYYKDPRPATAESPNQRTFDFVVEEANPAGNGIMSATGTVLAGSIATGDQITVIDMDGNTLARTNISDITNGGVAVTTANFGERVTLTIPGLNRETFGRCARVYQ